MKDMSYLTPEQILAIILRLPFFDAFDADEHRLFAGENTRLFCYDTGEFLIQEGDKDRGLFILLAGAASVVKEGASIPLAMLGPGHLFGEIAFLTQRKRTTNVIVHPMPPDIVGNQDLLDPQTIKEFQALLEQNEPATAVAIQFHQSILAQMARSTRIKLKNQIIQRLMLRVDTMNERVIQLTGHETLLSVDEGLDFVLRQEQDVSPEVLENTQERIIEQLVEFVEELNHHLVFDSSTPHV